MSADSIEAKRLVLERYPDAFAWDIMEGEGVGITSATAGRCIGIALDDNEGDAWIDAASKLPGEWI